MKGKPIPDTLLLALAMTLSAGAGPLQLPEPGPTSAGSRIAALVRLSREGVTAEAVGELRRGLSAEEPSVRAAAARVAHSIAAVDVLPELRQALAAEQDAGPALEEAWALADLDATAASNDVLQQAVTREGLESAVVQGIVSGRGPRVVPLWAALRHALDAQAPSVIAGLRAGLHQESGTLFASFAVRDGLEKLFGSLLSSGSIQVDPTMGLAGLAASSSAMRTASYIFLAGLPSAPPSCEGCDRKEPETPTERFARHLFEAASGQPPSETFAAVLASLAKDENAKRTLKARYRDQPRIFRGLSSGDRSKVLKVLEWNRDNPVAGDAFELSSTIKTLSGHPEGLARAVLEATNCIGKDGAFDAVEVWHKPGGRLTRIAPVKSESSQPGCGEAALLLGITSLASDGDAHAVTILPERPAFLACLAGDGPSPRSRAGVSERVGGRIQEPRKVRNVAPVYPETAKTARLQGVVLVEASISESGCVRSLKVLRSAAGMLDLSALDAVSGWVYTPTLLDGVPVPVTMTVTVNFRLN